MKILVITRSTIQHIKNGGMENITNNIILGLNKCGNDITLLTTSLSKSQDRKIENDYHGIKYISLPACSPASYSAEFNNEIVKFLKDNHSYDIIYSISSSGEQATNNIYGIPVVAAWHGSMFQNDVMNIIKYYIANHKLNPFNIEDFLINVLKKTVPVKHNLLRKFDYHIATNSYMKDTITYCNIDGDKIAVIELSVPHYFREHRLLSKVYAKNFFGLDPNKITLGLIGRSDPVKGHYQFAEILDYFGKDKFQILLIGEDCKNSIFNNINLVCKSKILDNKDMFIAYRAMDLFINTVLAKSSYDMSIKESISSGIKAIAPEGPTYGNLFKRLDMIYGLNNPLGTFHLGDKISLKNAIFRILNRPLPDDYTEIDKLCDQSLMINEYNTLFNNIISGT